MSVSVDLNHKHEEFAESIGDTSFCVNNKGIRIILNDALHGLKLLEDKSIKCIVTSPPYFWLRDYGVPDQLGMEESIDDYIDRLVQIMSECYRILSDDGVMYLNLGDTYYSGRGESKGIDKKSSKRRFGLRAVDRSGGMSKGLKPKTIIGMPWRVAIAMTEKGWILRSPIIWNRVSALPEAVKDRPRRQFEYLFMFVKSRKYHFDQDYFSKIGEQDIWSISVGNKSDKTDTKVAPFPIELALRCILLSSSENDYILDPFMGIGTTLLAANSCGRNAIGIDLSEEACLTAINRIRGL